MPHINLKKVILYNPIELSIARANVKIHFSNGSTTGSRNLTSSKAKTVNP